MNGDMVKQLVDVVSKDDSSMYEDVLMEKTFHNGFTHADFIIYILGMYNDELSNIMNDIPEEYAQDLHTAWEATSRVISKMKGETK